VTILCVLGERQCEVKGGIFLSTNRGQVYLRVDLRKKLKLYSSEGFEGPARFELPPYNTNFTHLKLLKDRLELA
jgi:hypothetical protein